MKESRKEESIIARGDIALLCDEDRIAEMVAEKIATGLNDRGAGKVLILGGRDSRRLEEINPILNHLDLRHLESLIETKKEGIGFLSVDEGIPLPELFSCYQWKIFLNPVGGVECLARGDHVLRLIDMNNSVATDVAKEIVYCEERFIPLVRYAIFVVNSNPSNSDIGILRDETGRTILTWKELFGWLNAGEELVNTDKKKNNVKQTLLQELLDFLEPLALAGETEAGLRNHGREALKKAVSRFSEAAIPQTERERLINSLLDEAMGYGPIEELMKDDSISEIMVNGTRNIYVEREGRLDETELKFSSTNQLRRVIDRMLSPVGRRVDESSPLVDARLFDGSRINVVIPPLSVGEPIVTIRRFNKHKFSTFELISNGMLEEKMLSFLLEAVRMRVSIIISGGTGSGKTTLLEILTSGLNEQERIITIEDTAELILKHKHVVRLEGRPPNIEGKGEVTIRHLVKNALRMRPDRIVVGECRGAEALDMLQAMNTGHEGSLTTVHANSARDAISRLETMVLLAGSSLPLGAIRDQLASAVHLLVHVARLSSGKRVVLEISEISGREGDRIVLKELVTHGDGGFIYSGWMPGRNLPPLR